MKYICIGATYLKEGQWVLKHWGDNKFTQFLFEFHKKHPEYIFVFVGSEQDRGDADRIIANMNPMYQKTGDPGNPSIAIKTSEVPLKQCVNLCGFSDDIKDTAAVLSQAVLYIGNDSGLAHIAAAVGTPTVTIFTFTNPVKNKPIGRGKVVMVPCANRLSCQHGSWQNCEAKGCCNVPVDKVLEATYALLD